MEVTDRSANITRGSADFINSQGRPNFKNKSDELKALIGLKESESRRILALTYCQYIDSKIYKNNEIGGDHCPHNHSTLYYEKASSDITSTITPNKHSLEVYCSLENFLKVLDIVLCRLADTLNFDKKEIGTLYKFIDNNIPLSVAQLIDSQKSRFDDHSSVQNSIEIMSDSALIPLNIMASLSLNPSENFYEIMGFSYASIGLLKHLIEEHSINPTTINIIDSIHTELNSFMKSYDNPTLNSISIGMDIFSFCISNTTSVEPPTNLEVSNRCHEILMENASYAVMHHKNTKLGGRLISEWFSEANIDIDGFLHALIESPWINKACIDESTFFTNLLSPCGRMSGVFTDKDTTTIKRRISNIIEGNSNSNPATPHNLANDFQLFQSSYLAKLEKHAIPSKYQPGNYRSSFHYMTNIAQHPVGASVSTQLIDSIFSKNPVAIHSPSDLELSNMLVYSQFGFEKIIEKSYFESMATPEVSLNELAIGREQLRVLHLYYAPFALIDGVWLKNVSQDRYKTALNSGLFNIFIDEFGGANFKNNHANVYRKLMIELGIDRDFTNLNGLMDCAELPDDTFKMPCFVTAISLNTQNYFPELLGLNLAIELAGLGRYNEEIIDLLEKHGINAMFWRLHVSADNFSSGHSRQSLQMVTDYMDEIENSYGSEAGKVIWLRVVRGYLHMRNLFHDLHGIIIPKINNKSLHEGHRITV